MTIQESLDKINNTLCGYRDKIDIVLVAHVLTPRGYNNPLQINCSDTEHFTLQEFNEIYTGIVAAGFFIRLAFFNELDFIKDITSKMDDYKNTVVFNLCRNGLGPNKKTVVPAICDLLGVIYTSSGAGSCSLARNKWLFSTLLNTFSIPTPVTGKSYTDFITRLSHDCKIIQKPIYESASQGISDNNISTVMQLEAIPQVTSIMYQEYIDGFECEVPIFKIEDTLIPLPPIGISFANNEKTGILSGTESMNNQYNFYALETILPNRICQEIQQTALKTFNALDMSVYGRIDFRIQKDTMKYYVIDISTTPYVTKHSSFNYAFELENCKYEDIFTLIIGSSLYRWQDKIIK